MTTSSGAGLRKPPHVFDRDREWDGLIRFATSPDPDARLGIVSGRRRQGKTYLLDAVASAVDGFFYTATEDTETDALANFGRALAEWIGGGRYAFAGWEEALDLLFTAVTGKLIVIDEFPYLSKASPSLPSPSRCGYGRVLPGGWSGDHDRGPSVVCRHGGVTGRSPHVFTGQWG